MKIFHGINQVRKFKNAVVALGVFDGVHRGHVNILRSAVTKAHSIKGTSVVMTFYPHPQGEESLYSLEHRLRLFQQIGIDACIVVNFTETFAGMAPKDFIKEILANRIGANYVYVGRNFRFGKGAKGDLKTLEESADIYGYELKAFSVVKIKNRPISSTYIRRLIKGAQLKKAEHLLSRPVSILGSVIPGNFLGRIIGFPTANIDPHHEVIPAPGIYAVRVILEGKRYAGVCYIGTRPTFMKQEKKCKTRIEAHIFNFNKNIYSKFLEIQFIKKIRRDLKFATLAMLKRQIEKDAAIAKRILILH